jgi:hypothetical protein
VDQYRNRSGDIRKIYSIRDDRLVVLVLRVAHRRDVYRDLSGRGAFETHGPGQAPTRSTGPTARKKERKRLLICMVERRSRASGNIRCVY